MARIDTLTNFLTDIANAIRTKKGTKDPIQAANFDTEIASIEIGGEGGIVAGLEYNSVDSEGFPLVVTTKGLKKLANNFFRNINENNGQFIRTTRINLSEDITQISAAVFRECGSLTAVVIYSSEVPTLSNSNSFMITPIAEGTGNIYVRDELVEDYKSATNWSTYADKIKSINELG